LEDASVVDFDFAVHDVYAGLSCVREAGVVQVDGDWGVADVDFGDFVFLRDSSVTCHAWLMMSKASGCIKDGWHSQ
jgi:hypothetical protein